MYAEQPPPHESSRGDERQRSLELNLLILLGYNNAVAVDLSMRIGEIVQIAGDPEQTDGTSYSREEVERAIENLADQELIRLVRKEFDASALVKYATGLHDDHSIYITPGGVLYVKRLTDRAEQDEAMARRIQ